MSPGRVCCQVFAKVLPSAFKIFLAFQNVGTMPLLVQMLSVKDDRRRNFFRSVSSAHQTSAVQAYLNDLHNMPH